MVTVTVVLVAADRAEARLLPDQSNTCVNVARLVETRSSEPNESKRGHSEHPVFQRRRRSFSVISGCELIGRPQWARIREAERAGNIRSVDIKLNPCAQHLVPSITV